MLSGWAGIRLIPANNFCLMHGFLPIFLVRSIGGEHPRKEHLDSKRACDIAPPRKKGFRSKFFCILKFSNP
jgi:hypothetical protein